MTPNLHTVTIEPVAGSLRIANENNSQLYLQFDFCSPSLSRSRIPPGRPRHTSFGGDSRYPTPCDFTLGAR